MTAETSDVTSKDHGKWGASEVSRVTWEITSENLYTTSDYDSMFEQMTAGTPIMIRFGLKQAPSDPDMVPADGSTALPYWTSQNTFYQGKALITSLVANANNGENATYNITLTGVGKIQKTTIN
jgi:predicted secreted protein